MAEIKDKIIQTLKELDKKIVERPDENRMILLGVLAGEHILILGPPGTAKSMTARTICQLISNGEFFDYLLTRFTTPDEIFGCPPPTIHNSIFYFDIIFHFIRPIVRPYRQESQLSYICSCGAWLQLIYRFLFQLVLNQASNILFFGKPQQQRSFP